MAVEDRTGAAVRGAQRSNTESTPSCPACGGELAAATLRSPDRLCGLPGMFSVARCHACGLGVTLPPLASSELAALYATNYGIHDELPTGLLRLVSKAVQRIQARQSMRTTPLSHLAALAPGELLDVGCGRGDLASWFVRRGWRVSGVEPSAQACAVARGQGVRALTGTLEEVPLEPGRYDAACFRHSLEHVADPLSDLRLVYAALREGGVVIVIAPNFGGWQSRMFGGRWFSLDLPRHRFHFNARALRAMLERAGFERVQTASSSSSVGLPGSVQYALAGRCVFPSGIKQRIVVGLCAPMGPLIGAADRLAGDGDVLHAIAYRR
jgi:SAM-dependent methyltransferase